jgi:hypothetical protein
LEEVTGDWRRYQGFGGGNRRFEEVTGDWRR